MLGPTLPPLFTSIHVSIRRQLTPPLFAAQSFPGSPIRASSRHASHIGWMSFSEVMVCMLLTVVPSETYRSTLTILTLVSYRILMMQSCARISLPSGGPTQEGAEWSSRRLPNESLQRL